MASFCRSNTACVCEPPVCDVRLRSSHAAKGGLGSSLDYLPSARIVKGEHFSQPPPLFPSTNHLSQRAF